MNASRSYSRSLSPLALQGESSPWAPILREPPIRRAFRLTQRRGWLRRHTAPRLPLPLRRRKVRLSPFPPGGENCARSLAPPLPGEPASLGFAGRDGRLAKTPPGTAPDEHSVLIVAYPTPSGPSGHLPLTGGVGPGPPLRGTRSCSLLHHFRRAKFE